MSFKDKDEQMLKNLLLSEFQNLPLLYQKEVLDFIEYLKSKIKKNETLYLSESSLAKDWLLREEDEAWKDL